jgi:hypothetical protein
VGGVRAAAIVAVAHRIELRVEGDERRDEQRQGDRASVNERPQDAQIVHAEVVCLVTEAGSVVVARAPNLGPISCPYTPDCYTAIDEETGDEIERVEALPCRSCAEVASLSGRRIDTCTAPARLRSGSWRARLMGIAGTPMDAKNTASGSQPMRRAPTAPVRRREGLGRWLRKTLRALNERLTFAR